MNPALSFLNGRSVLRIERRIGHPVAKVWRAVTEPDHLAHWFPAAVEMEPRAGAKMAFGFPGDAMPPGEGEVLEFDPPKVFAFTWNGESLRFELRPDGEATVLVFHHTFDDRPFAASFATGWQTCIDALEELLAGKPGPTPDSVPDYAVRHDALAEAFGLTGGEATETDGGWTVRFERLLPEPAGEVWAELTGGSEPRPGAPAPAATARPGLAAGPLTAAEPERLLEYGSVRWELAGGHPAGTRVTLTQTLPPGPRPAGELAAWQVHLELLAARLRGERSRPWPAGRVAELEKRYAEAR